MLTKAKEKMVKDEILSHVLPLLEGLSVVEVLDVSYLITTAALRTLTFEPKALRVSGTNGVEKSDVKNS